MKVTHTLLAFNRGLISRLALSRIDLKRMALSAETFTNWMPRVLGSMMLRPGTAYIGTTRSNAESLSIPFVFSISDTALIELTNLVMRVRVSDSVITRVSVSSAVTNGTFTTDVSGWTDSDESGATSAWATGGYLSLLGTGTNAATRDQQVTVAAGDQNKEHGLAIHIQRGEVTLRVGSSSGGEQYVTERVLRAGYHSIAFTPTGNFHIRLSNSDDIAALVDSIAVESAGDMVVTTSWPTASLDEIRYEQSGDVIFCACRGYAPMRIERQATRSWSVVEYAPTDGPFRSDNTGPTRISTSALTGDITLTATKDLFASSHVGALFRLTSAGQEVSATLVAEDSFTNSIRVTGVGSGRVFALVLAANAQFRSSTTVTLQRSIAEEGDWVDVATYTAATSTTYDDELDNQIAYYRIGIKTGDYTATVTGAAIDLGGTGYTVSDVLTVVGGSGTAATLTVTSVSGGVIDGISVTTAGDYSSAPSNPVSVTGGTGADATFNLTLSSDGIDASLDFAAGSITGIARITAYSSATSVSASVLVDLGGTASTDDWAEGAWSSKRGYPTSVVLHDGRLWWSGKDNIWGSISDAYSSFDDSVEGDSGPISRTIGAGPVDTINWMISTSNLLIGGQGSEFVARSSSLDEPLTPTQFGLKAVSTLGSAAMRAVKVDNSCVFVQRNGMKVFEISFDSGSYNYVSNDLAAIVPEIGSPGIVRVAVQRIPDTRIHFVRSDGKVAILVFDKIENVTCWLLVEMDGEVEDVAVLPGTEEDSVYYTVKRTIDGSTVRYLEKWSLESECQGGATCKLMDSHITYSGVSATSMTGLDHLEGETVCVWGNSKDLGTYTVGSGAITLSEAATLAYIGLPYTAQFKSAKLAIASQTGNPLTQRKRLDHVGLILADTHAQGLTYGQDFDHMDDLPLMESYTTVDQDSVWDSYDADSIELNGTWDTDARICLQAESPRPCTVLAVVLSGAGHDKS